MCKFFAIDHYQVYFKKMIEGGVKRKQRKIKKMNSHSPRY
jgi:hypothetical protein